MSRCAFGFLKPGAKSRRLQAGSTSRLCDFGRAKLDLEGQTLNLKAGDSWLVPAGATHEYTILEPFTAVEATAPPAEVHGRDEAV